VKLRKRRKGRGREGRKSKGMKTGRNMKAGKYEDATL